MVVKQTNINTTTCTHSINVAHYGQVYPQILLPHALDDILISMSTDDTLPWTTSRCNRLLRPLSSKLTKLRKELERPRTASAETRNVSSAFAIKGSPQKTTNFTRPANKPRGFEKARDPDWRPGARPGTGKKTTYGGRGRGRVPDLQKSGSHASGSREGLRAASIHINTSNVVSDELRSLNSSSGRRGANLEDQFALFPLRM